MAKIRCTMRVTKDLREKFDLFCSERNVKATQMLCLFGDLFSFDRAKWSNVLFGANGDFTAGEMISYSIFLSDSAKKNISETAEMYGLTFSFVLRQFMIYCVSHNDLPTAMLSSD